MISLSHSDAVFMLSVLPLEADLKAKLLSVKFGSQLSLDEDSADRLRDHCGERLQTHGFDEDYNPTDEGRHLENLIDVLYIG